MSAIDVHLLEPPSMAAMRVCLTGSGTYSASTEGRTLWLPRTGGFDSLVDIRTWQDACGMLPLDQSGNVRCRLISMGTSMVAQQR